MNGRLSNKQMELIRSIWNDYYPRDIFHQMDKRLEAISIFVDYFNDQNNIIQFSDLSEMQDNSLYFDVETLNETSPFPDFINTLCTQPNEVIGTMGIALCLTNAKLKSNYKIKSIIYPRFQKLYPFTSFNNLKSNIVGQLISLKGYVIKVSSSSPIVEKALFQCQKCGQNNLIRFEDGVFMTPTVCAVEKCNGKYLDFLRSSVVTTDFQRIKLQEMSDPSQLQSMDETVARVPRTFEVEVRGPLVDLIVPGDIIETIGVVKTVQAEPPRGNRWGGGGRGSGGRGTGRESGLYHLYLHANSLFKVKGKNSGSSHSSNSNIHSQNINKKQKRYLDDSPTVSDNPSQSNAYSQSQTSSSLSQRNPLSAQSDLSASYSMIRKIALTEHCVGLLVASLCPAILGHELVKLGILCSLFGGTLRVDAHDGPRSRSDVHVLVVGDPGLGKSQLLRAAASVAPRSVYVCGNTATNAGLTVSVTREGRGGEVTIEAGALVLADQGTCCIDELDKMTCDPHALLEAMEQQQISIAKSGVVTALRSRTSVIAAANPVAGHYNRKKTVCENLKMAAALLSRFDLVFLLLDQVDEGRDRLVSEHIMNTHSTNMDQERVSNWDSTSSKTSIIDTWSGGASQQSPQEVLTLTQSLRRGVVQVGSDPLPASLLRDYISYAKEYCHPRLTPAAAKVLQRLYLNMRARAKLGESIPVTTRHLESLIRLAQARAKMELREEVSESDAQDVVHLLQESLLDACTTDTGELDFSRKGGMSMAKQVKAMTKALAREAELRQSQMFPLADLERIASRIGLGNMLTSGKSLYELLEVMRTEGYLLLKGPRLYQLQAGSY